MRKTAAALLTIAVLVGCNEAEAKKAPKTVPWSATFGWSWKAGVGPLADMNMVAAQGARIKMRCDSWMTKGNTFVLGLGVEGSGINYVYCPVAGRWFGKGTYRAHFSFIGRITGQGYIWLPALPGAEPSCRVSGGRKLLVCDDIKRTKHYAKKGVPG